MGTRTLFRFARDCRLKALDEFSTANVSFGDMGEKGVISSTSWVSFFFGVSVDPRRVRGRKRVVEQLLGKLLAISGGTCKRGGNVVQRMDKARIYCVIGVFVFVWMACR
jgi:hypothetical protein